MISVRFGNSPLSSNPLYLLLLVQNDYCVSALGGGMIPFYKSPLKLLEILW